MEQGTFPDAVVVTKQLVFKDEARHKIVAGITQLAQAVRGRAWWSRA